MPQRGRTDIKRLISNARTNTIISKLVTTVFIAIFGFAVFLPMTNIVPSPRSSVPKNIIMIGSVTAFQAVVLFLIVFMGLQVSTAFVSSKMAEVLSGFPLTKQEVSNVLFICFLRMFDIPLVAAIAIFLSAYFFIAGGTIFGGMLLLIVTVITEIFALSLAIALAKFFYAKVAGSGGRSRWKTLTRLLFMVVWILPSLVAYLIIYDVSSIVQSLTTLTQSLSSFLQIIALVYPFSFGFLSSYLTFAKPSDLALLGSSVAASVAYIFLAFFSYRWVTRTIRTIGTSGTIARTTELVKDTFVKPQIPWFGIIRKDLRIASRVPSFAALFLLPAIETIVFSVSLSSVTDLTVQVILSSLVGISMIMLILPPILLSMEGFASSFTRSLPLTKRTLISSKTLLSIITYLISMLVLFFTMLYLKRDFSLVLTYGLIHALAVYSGITLELTLLVRRFWREGFAVGNIYSRITVYIMIFIPGAVIVATPIITAVALLLLAPNLVLPIFLTLALAESAVMTAIVVFQK